MFEIVGVVISPMYKRRGIGKEILNTICSRLKEKGNVKVVLFTLGHPENEDTIRFYTSIGYKNTNFEEDFFRPGYSRVTFFKELI